MAGKIDGPGVMRVGELPLPLSVAPGEQALAPCLGSTVELVLVTGLVGDQAPGA